MSLVSKILLQTAVALLLVNVVLYFVGGVIESYRQRHLPRLIRPFDISGTKEEPANGAKRGTALAYLLSGRLAEIGKQMRASEEALEEAQQASKDSKVVMPVDRESLVKPISLPDTVFRPLDLNMSVASVEVGKLLSWLHDWFVQDRALSLSVIYSGDKAVVTGAAAGSSSEPIWVEGSATDELNLITDVAYAIARGPFAQAHQEVADLEGKEFRDLMNGLQGVAKLSRKAPRGGVTAADYAAEFDQIETLTAKLPKWGPLLHVAADLAERGEKTDKSLAFYKRELAVLSGKAAEPARASLESKIRQLEEKLLAASATPPTMIAATLTQQSAAQKLLALIGATETIPATSAVPVIGIVGPLPEARLLPKGIKARVVTARGSEKAPTTDPHELEGYIAGLLQEASLVAPGAQFVLAPVQVTTAGGGLSTSSILEAVNRLADPEEEVRILVVPYGPFEGKVFDSVLSTLGQQGIISVLPAGNDPAVSPPVRDKTARQYSVVAAAVDLEGRPAAFSSRSDDVLWAPGHYLVIDPESGSRQRSGTSYAAAVTAAAVARLLGSFPNLAPAQIIAALRETAQAHVDKNVRVINVQAAAVRLASLSPAPH